MMERAHVRIECTLILNKHLSRTFMKLCEDSSLGTSNVIAQQSHSVWQGAGKLENAGAWRENGGKILPSCSLTWVFFIFLFGQWKSRQANKDGSQSRKLGNWTVVLIGGFREGLGSIHPNGLLHTVFYRAAILIQFYFDLCNCYAAQAQHWPIYIGLKMMLVDSSLNGIKLPLQFISRSYM